MHDLCHGFSYDGMVFGTLVYTAAWIIDGCVGYGFPSSSHLSTFSFSLLPIIIFLWLVLELGVDLSHFMFCYS